MTQPMEPLFGLVGWAFVLVLALGTLAIIFTDIFRKMTVEQRVVFAVVSPAVIGYVIASRFLAFSDPISVLGVIASLYVVVPSIFFYFKLKELKGEGE